MNIIDLPHDDQRYKTVVKWKDGRKDNFRGLNRLEAAQVRNEYETHPKVSSAEVKNDD